jgi:hypothetical protein
MKAWIWILLSLQVTLPGLTLAQPPAPAASGKLAHTVFFTLKDSSDQSKAKLVQACHRYLKDHPGVVFFAVGTRAVELQRPVNDQAFHVSLHVVFADKASHDLYQKAPKHLKFIEENQANWQQVRVFDSFVE